MRDGRVEGRSDKRKGKKGRNIDKEGWREGGREGEDEWEGNVEGSQKENEKNGKEMRWWRKEQEKRRMKEVEVIWKERKTKEKNDMRRNKEENMEGKISKKR